MNYKLLRETFYNTYKSYMDFLRIIHKENDMFYILILRRPINNDLVNVDIIINSMNPAKDEHPYRFKNNAILNYTQSIELIKEIRDDFKMNHYISYSVVHESDSIQRMQNTNYTLNIKLINEDEIEEALEFNQKINTNADRHKALLRK